MNTYKRKKSLAFSVCFVLLLSICLLATGTGIAFKPAKAIKTAHALGTGTAADPFVITNFSEFTNSLTEMAVPGTVTSIKYFKITSDFEVDGGAFPSGVKRNLANNIVLYGEKGGVPGARVTLTKLNTSLFDKVIGPNTAIKNINFIGNGNIAREFSGVMDNVHHSAPGVGQVGSISNLNVIETGAVGGLVDISNNATFRHCSNNVNVLLSTSSGGASPVNGGIIGEARGNLHMTNTHNYQTIETFDVDVEATGGLIGRIINESQEKATIQLSSNTGIIKGKRSGGLVGKKEGAGELEIRESYNTGWINNRGTTTSSNDGTALAQCAGILAWATGGQIEIESCYNRGNVVTGSSSTDTTLARRTSGSAGIFSTNNEATVTISRTYNTGNVRHAIAVATIPAAPNFSLTGSHSVLGTNVMAVSSGVLSNQTTVDDLNQDLTPPAFMKDGSNPPVLVGLTEITYTFHANAPDATLNGEESLRFTAWAGTETINESLRTHFTFIGWSEDAQAETATWTTLAAIPSMDDRSRDFYAVWSARKYIIDFELSPDEDIQDYQQYYVLDSGIPGNFSKDTMDNWAFVMGQSISLRTELVGASPLVLAEAYFVEWQVDKGNGWEEFTAGNRVFLVNPESHPSQFNIYERDGDFIDEDFIATYVNEITGTLKIRGLYDRSPIENPSFNLSIEAVTLNAQDEYVKRTDYNDWGITKIGDNSFPRIQALERIESEENAVIHIKPHNHYDLVRFDIMEWDVVAGDWSCIDTITPGEPDENGFYSYTQYMDQTYAIYVVLKRTEYKITITAETVDGEPIIGTDLNELVGAQQTYYITIGSTFSGVTLAPSNNSYRLIHPWQNNYKIKSVQDNEYVLRSTNPYGQITEDFNELFTAFWDSAEGEIKIIAIYEKQVKLAVVIPTENFREMGAVVVEISHPDDTFRDTMINGFSNRKFRFGSVVDVYIELFGNARVQDIKVNLDDKNVDERIESLKLVEPLYRDTYVISFSFELEKSTVIEITFEVNDYEFNLAVVDENGNISPSFPLPAVERAAILNLLHTDGRDWRRGDKLGDNDIIEITLEQETQWDNDWRFDGLWLIYGNGEPPLELDSQEHNYFSILTLIEGSRIITIELNDVFVGTYLQDNPEFTIEIRFTRIFNVNVRLALPGSGDVTTNMVIEGEERDVSIIGRRPFPVGTELKIILTPEQYYLISEIGVVDLMDPENEIEIKEGENEDGSTYYYIVLVTTKEHDIRVHYKPEQTKVNTSGDKGSGTITNNNLDKIGIGTEVIITFKPKTGLQRSSWKINGVDIKDISAEYGMNVRINGNTVSFTVNDEWYGKYSGDLNSDIGTKINTFLVVGIVVIALVVIALVIGIVLMILASKKRKADYALALEKMKVAKAQLGHADFLKSLKGE